MELYFTVTQFLAVGMLYRRPPPASAEQDCAFPFPKGQGGSWDHAVSSKPSYNFLNYFFAHYTVFPLIAGLPSMLINCDPLLNGPSSYYAYAAISLFNRVSIFIKRTAFISTVETTENWLYLQKGIYIVWEDLQGNQGSKIMYVVLCWREYCKTLQEPLRKVKCWQAKDH